MARSSPATPSFGSATWPSWMRNGGRPSRNRVAAWPIGDGICAWRDMRNDSGWSMPGGRASSPTSRRRREVPDACPVISPGRPRSSPSCSQPRSLGIGEDVWCARRGGSGTGLARLWVSLPYDKHIGTEIRVALIGYGLAGACFHAPIIATTPGLRLTTIVTSNPGRRDRAKRDHPAAQVVSNPEDVFSQMSRHDLVVIATPNSTHVPLSLAALAAGQAVVVDKPRRCTAEEGGRG